MSRISMKIYKVPVVPSSEIKTKLNSQNYLIGVTEADIVKKEDDYLHITLTPNNFSSNDASKIFLSSSMPIDCVVQKDSVTNEYYVLLTETNTKYYIPKSFGVERREFDQIFEFYVNPIRVTPIYRKIYNEIRTRGGWEVQHWGNALTELKVDCITGGMLLKEDGSKLSKTESIVESQAWKKVQKLRQIYEEDHKYRNQPLKSLLGINYYDLFLIGFFTEFSGPIADAEKPYLMTFGFTFKVLDYMQLDTAYM